MSYTTFTPFSFKTPVKQGKKKVKSIVGISLTMV